MKCQGVQCRYIAYIILHRGIWMCMLWHLMQVLWWLMTGNDHEFVLYTIFHNPHRWNSLKRCFFIDIVCCCTATIHTYITLKSTEWFCFGSQMSWKCCSPISTSFRLILWTIGVFKVRDAVVFGRVLLHVKASKQTHLEKMSIFNIEKLTNLGFADSYFCLFLMVEILQRHGWEFLSKRSKGWLQF